MELKTTPLTEIHKELGAKLVPFAGFSMPVRYGNIVDEHHTVRNAAGLFDLCHMGRITVSGEQATAFLQYLVTNNIEKMKEGQAHYALILNENGKVLDDVIVYKRPSNYLVVCNGANLDKINNWVEQKKSDFNVVVSDDSTTMSMIAIQGVNSLKIVSRLVDQDVSDMKYYYCGECNITGIPGMIARTGYTGEDGFELYASCDKIENIWHEALEKGKEHGLIPVGLAARDTLRLEAGMPLYGHEIDETKNPLEAGLKFGVKLKKGDFIGRNALLQVKEKGIEQKLVCLELETKRIGRQGSKILLEGEEVGVITSGTFSPTLQKSIAMGYVPSGKSEAGQEFSIQIGRGEHKLRVVKAPFYKRQ